MTTKVKTLNISLPEELRDRVVKEVAAGGYASVSEYIREAVREHLARRRTEVLQKMVLEGMRGEPVEVTPAVMKRLQADHRKRLAARRR